MIRANPTVAGWDDYLINKKNIYIIYYFILKGIIQLFLPHYSYFSINLFIFPLKIKIFVIILFLLSSLSRLSYSGFTQHTLTASHILYFNFYSVWVCILFLWSIIIGYRFCLFFDDVSVLVFVITLIYKRTCVYG